MAGPIAHGVNDALQRQRGPRSPRRGSPLGAWSYFVATTLGLSWLSFAVRSGALGAVELALAMAWPPVIGAWLARLVRAEDAPTWHRPEVRDVAIAAAAAGAAIAIVGPIRVPGPEVALLAVTALAAEYGWRGRSLDWLVERTGRIAAVAIHAAMFGLWCAPLGVTAAAVATGVGLVLGALRRPGAHYAPGALVTLALAIVLVYR